MNQELPAQDLPTLSMFGFDVCTLPIGTLVGRCADKVLASRANIDDRRPLSVVALNPEKVMRSREDELLKQSLDQAGLILPDGIGLCAGAAYLERKLLRRVAGCDFMSVMCEQAEKSGLSIFLYGGKAQVSETAQQELRRMFPDLKIAGARHGYLNEQERDALTEELRELKPDIVFVALGSPAQEKWILEQAALLPIGLVQGVGGSLDVIAGTVNRAPMAFRLIGLEWFYRLASQPARWRRQLALLDFARLVILGPRGKTGLSMDGSPPET